MQVHRFRDTIAGNIPGHIYVDSYVTTVYMTPPTDADNPTKDRDHDQQ